MMNFLTDLWKQGATAQEAFEVQIGLGITMTPADILDGKLMATAKLAIPRPAEFILITFQQQMQQA
jgi:phage tail sheath protein FI